MNQGTQPATKRYRFSLRTLLIIVTLSALGILAKQWWDHQQRLKAIGSWVDACAEEAEKHIGPFSSACPKTMEVKHQVELLAYGAIHFEPPNQLPAVDRRVVCLKLLAENFPENSLEPLLSIAIDSDDLHIQKLAIHLVALYREESSLEKLNPLLESKNTDPGIRGAIVDLIGLLHTTTYPLYRTKLNCHPPIATGPIRDQAHVGVVDHFAVNDRLNNSYRERLNDIMLHGKSAEERIAAARAMVAWPPKNYKLRYAEWGLWLDVEGQLKLSKALLEEIPPFVHQTGNPLDSFLNRISPPAIGYKPVVHLTASQAMAVDLEVIYFQGRPWYAYPRADDFNLNFSDNGVAGSELAKLNTDSLDVLTNTREGYPWLLPLHRKHTGHRTSEKILGLGLRWQSLIVSPEKQSWINAPDTTDNPKYQWWKNLRDVDCSWISSCGESEKFLFYDGPTLAKSPLKIELNDSKLKVSPQQLFERPIPVYLGASTMSERGQAKPTRMGFFIEVDDQGVAKGQVLELENGKDSVLDLNELSDLAGGPLKEIEVRETLLSYLHSAGLKIDEANGLLNSWQTPFFESPGRRVIYFLTPHEYDLMVRMNCRPAPTETIRVGLAMKEFESK